MFLCAVFLCAPLSATEVIVSPNPPPPGLVELLTAIAEGDQPEVQAELAARPELATLEIRVHQDSWSPKPAVQMLGPSTPVPYATGMTVLHFAAQYGKSQAVTALLDCGADLRIKDDHGNTPLEAAFLCPVPADRLATVKVLLARGADANQDLFEGWRPLHRMVQAGNADKDLLEALLAAGADIEAQAKDGGTPLMLAARRLDDRDCWRMLKLLLTHGAKVDARDDLGRTALMLMAWYQSGRMDESVAVLIDAGADLWAQDNKGWNVRDYAFDRNDPSGLHGSRVYLQASLYPYYAKLPGLAQLALLALVLAVVGGWARRRMRAVPALTAEAWAKRLGLPTDFEAHLNAKTQANVADRLRRQGVYERMLIRTQLSVAAGITLTLFTTLDSFHLRTPTTQALMAYAVGYILGYCALFLRFRWFTTAMQVCAVGYTALGVFFLILQGVLFQGMVRESVIAAMWCGVGLLFFYQSALFSVMAYQSLRMDWFDQQARKQCRGAMIAAEHTGIDTDDRWDTGGQG